MPLALASAVTLFERESRAGQDRILLDGGTERPRNSKYDWAPILYRAGGACGATHVGSGYFLTASHCVGGGSISIMVPGSPAEQLPQGGSVFHHPTREVSLVGPFAARPVVPDLSPATRTDAPVGSVILGHYKAAFMCGSMDTTWSGTGCLASTKAKLTAPQPGCSPGAPQNGDSGGAVAQGGKVVAVHCDTPKASSGALEPALAVPLDAATIAWIRACVAHPPGCSGAAKPRAICSCR